MKKVFREFFHHESHEGQEEFLMQKRFNAEARRMGDAESP
jgi:hypothetical protein